VSSSPPNSNSWRRPGPERTLRTCSSERTTSTLTAKPDIPTHFDLATAREAEARGETARWVGRFLASAGSDNPELAAALAQRRHWWVGPIEVPLEDLRRLAGPEAGALVTVRRDEWDEDVERMQQTLDAGWEPPPLLAEFRDGALWLQDGNHRYAALERARARTAWVLVYFDRPEDRDAFVAARAHRQ
jgi:hypothetical protein